MEIAAAVPWESGKRSLFSIFSMASSRYLVADREDTLLHLDLESTLLLPISRHNAGAPVGFSDLGYNLPHSTPTLAFLVPVP